jgi:AraC-like DNA-binding protein
MTMIKFHDHGYGEFKSGRNFETNSWPHFDLFCVHNGRVQMQLSHRDSVELIDGQCILIYPHTYFGGCCMAPANRISIQHFELQREAGKSINIGGLELPSSFEQILCWTNGHTIFPRKINRALEEDIHRAIRLANEPSTPIIMMMRTSLLALILSQLLSEPGASVDRTTVATIDFDPMFDWLQSRLDQTTSLNQMSQFVNLSSSHFRAVFSRQLGVSPGQYLQQLRLTEAYRLLRETQLTIKQISRRISYDDIAHFYRFFSQHDKLTPAAYRKRFQIRL